jgi:hypothetical protein
MFCAGQNIHVPQKTAWRELLKSCIKNPYILEMRQAITGGEKVRLRTFYEDIWSRFEEGGLLGCVIFKDSALLASQQ